METDQIHIAIVDDHTLFRNGVAALMSEFAELKVVFEAENGEQMQQMLNKHPLPQVILMDINMPKCGGIEATRLIRAYEKEHDCPSTFICGVSAFEDPSINLLWNNH